MCLNEITARLLISQRAITQSLKNMIGREIIKRPANEKEKARIVAKYPRSGIYKPIYVYELKK